MIKVKIELGWQCLCWAMVSWLVRGMSCDGGWGGKAYVGLWRVGWGEACRAMLSGVARAMLGYGEWVGGGFYAPGGADGLGRVWAIESRLQHQITY